MGFTGTQHKQQQQQQQQRSKVNNVFTATVNRIWVVVSTCRGKQVCKYGVLDGIISTEYG